MGGKVPIHLINESKAALEAMSTLENQPIIGVDIETYSLREFSDDNRAALDPYQSQIRLVSVAMRPDDQFVFDMNKLASSDLDALSAIPWVCHNALFEYRHLKHHGYQLPVKIHCSQLMARPIYHDILSLSDTCKRALSMDVDKTMQVSNWSGELTEDQLKYAALDAKLSLDLAYKLLPRLDREGSRRVYELYRENIPVVGDQLLHGISFDWEAHATLLARWEDEKAGLLLELKEHFGDINFRSCKQLSAWFRKNTSLQAMKKWPTTANGHLSTSRETLKDRGKINGVKPLLQLKAVEKLVSSYGKGYIKHRHPVTGRLHPDVMIAGTAAGRFCASRPNVQNPPRLAEFRSLFSSRPGRALVAADFSQIELRCAALLSNDTNMKRSYEEGVDLHTTTAAALADTTPELVTREQRQAAKAVNFGNLYQQGAQGLRRYARASYGVELSVGEAADMQKKFFKAYPDLARWQRKQIHTARVYRTTTTKLGLVRDFREREGYLQAECCNHPIQGAAAEVLLSSLVRLHAAIKDLDAQITNHVHDEIIVECSIQEVPQVKYVLEQSMCSGFIDIFEDGEALLSGLVEVKVGNNWRELK
jgi:DNA polymerase I